ncbi:MAG: hypothetical protein ILP22_08380 [Oscillospiraceae bacterium]|nr:hypothetical protein [Oscillospiraceae bacterium]
MNTKLNIFEKVRASVTMAQVAELYGIDTWRGMINCILWYETSRNYFCSWFIRNTYENTQSLSKCLSNQKCSYKQATVTGTI